MPGLDSSLKLNNIPLYVYTTLCLYILNAAMNKGTTRKHGYLLLSLWPWLPECTQCQNLSYDSYCARLVLYAFLYILVLSDCHAMVLALPFGVASSYISCMWCMEAIWAGIGFDAPPIGGEHISYVPSLWHRTDAFMTRFSRYVQL